jgi:hypothetical protein
MSDSEIAAAVAQLRSRAQAVGPLHADWDLIFDAEAILAGKPSLLQRATVEQMLGERTTR